MLNANKILKRYGTGEELLICIPGFGCNESLFTEVVKEYQNRYQVIVFDLTELEMPEEFELHSYAQILLNLLENQNELKDNKIVHLLGISMGGFIAQIFASLFKIPTTLSLWCTQGPVANGFERMHIIDNVDLDKLIHYNNHQIGYGSIKQTVCEETYHNRSLFLDLVAWKEKNLVSIELMKRQNNAVEKFLENRLPLEQIKCPVHIMMAKNDRLVSFKNCRKFKEIYDDFATITMIEKYDHLFFKENPSLVLEKQNFFFNSCTNEFQQSIN